MDFITIDLANETDSDRHREPVGLGIPFAQGALRDSSGLILVARDSSKTMPCQFRELCYWPDGTVRWLHIEFLATVPANSTREVLLQTGDLAPFPTKVDVKQAGQKLCIKTPHALYNFHPQSLSWTTSSSEEGHFSHQVTLADEESLGCQFVSAGAWTVMEKGPVSILVRRKGQWQRKQGTPLLDVACDVRIYGERGLSKVSVTPHNPRRARHPGGLWDLGDQGSAFFRSLQIETQCAGTGNISLFTDADIKAPGTTSATSACLYQDSSGGEHWNSPNHIDRNGDLTTRFRGFRLSVNGKLASEGFRANPQLSWENQASFLRIAMPRFWQNFPSAMKADSSKVIASLFPEESGQLYELQGGERKNQTIYMDHCDKNGNLDWVYTPTLPRIPASVYQKARAFPWFFPDTPSGPLDDLIQSGITGENNFFIKREQIDEYGWRNFGDVFADHETLYQPAGSAPLISHYNNQYDAIYGFARQFALSGDRRWFELMNDLAHHVVDIDIYHTNQDRSEYNNGLFWHTDHYLDAHTATHRTFSRHNKTSSTPGQTGGGPAAEHCYTTGLCFHYFITGDPESRQAALDLAGWMENLHEGNGGLLEQVLAFKKQDLPKLKALLKGERPTSHFYPFTRGTGNYLNALLDAWTLTGERRWMRLAERVISDTIHPLDNIEKRKLLDVETGWHYLILLASITRYLYLKREAGEHDEYYRYAHSSLTHYTRWMVANEKPFLHNPDSLEFPNDTWAAQDIRKATILFQAIQFDDAMKYEYSKKAQEWLEYVTTQLQQSSEATFARILVILLQNHGHYLTQNIHLNTHEATGTIKSSTPRSRQPHLTWPAITIRLLQRFKRAVLKFNPAREITWLKARLDRS